MKVLALNSSPRSGEESCTFKMLTHLVEGMREEGADVEVVNLREKKIKNCIGCFTCWTKTPGQCVLKDDMSLELFPKWKASDLTVYASPLYNHTINAAMGAFLERTLPAAQPFVERGDDGQMFHPLRGTLPASVTLTVCGFPVASEFDAMLEFFARTRHKDLNVVAEICRPGASMLSSPFLKDKADDVFAATRQAGCELIRAMEIAPETMARIIQPLGDVESYLKVANIFWKSCISEGVTPKEFEDKKMAPRPDSMDDFMFIFPFGLNAEAAGERKVLLQFNFSGDVNDSCTFFIEKGKIDSKKGRFENPDLTIDTPFDIWMDIMSLKADGQQLFMEQKYQVHGDLMLMMQLFQGGH